MGNEFRCDRCGENPVSVEGRICLDCVMGPELDRKDEHSGSLVCPQCKQSTRYVFHFGKVEAHCKRPECLKPCEDWMCKRMKGEEE